MLTFQQPKGFHQSYLYTIKANTLTYNIVDSDYYSPTIIVNLKISDVADSSMVWESDNPYEKWELKKITEKIKMPTLTKFDLESLQKYETEKSDFLSRAAKFKCVDKRTAAERTQDSLDVNSFKF